MVPFSVCYFEGIYFILFLNYLLSQKFKIFLRNNLHLWWSFLLSISGVAYSKHIVQIYSYHGGNDLQNRLEVCLYIYICMHALTHNCVFTYIHTCVCVCVCSYIVFSNYYMCVCVSAMNVFFFFFFQIDAHVGKVSDLGFSQPNRQLCIITCGEDKTIKV